MDIYTFLILAHTVATVLGVGGATLAEVLIIRALKDGQIDASEGNLLHGVYTTIRVGFMLAFISGISFLLLYKVNDQIGQLWSEVLWAKLTVVGIIGLNALLMQAHKIPLKIGGGISTVSWYAALFLGVFVRGVDADYLTIMFVYLVTVIIGIFALDAIRRLYGVKI